MKNIDEKIKKIENIGHFIINLVFIILFSFFLFIVNNIYELLLVLCAISFFVYELIKTTKYNNKVFIYISLILLFILVIMFFLKK